ncbi:hypothetical protein BDY24DRAFT_416828 [Mrakia frigida]|uniref:uncharacterized protein n=1 Tax=Mrakia frigida TaxID=29902 RepID=UPI003FCC07B4
MSGPSAVHFAELIGLTEGIDAPPAKILSAVEMQPARAMNDTLNYLSRAQRIAFFDKLSALYLPSLLRTFSYITLDPYQNEDGRCALWLSWACRTAETPSFGRLLRDHPEEAGSLYLRIGRAIAEFPESGWSNPSSLEILQRLLSYLDVFTSELVASFPSDSKLPNLEPSSKSKLVALLPRLKSTRTAAAHQLVILDAMATFTLDIKLLRRNKVIGGRYAVWTSCEIKNNQMGEAPNVNLELRKQHQRIDWKYHKASCFKSSW